MISPTVKRGAHLLARDRGLISPGCQGRLLRNARGAGSNITMKYQRRPYHFFLAQQPTDAPAGHAHRFRESADDKCARIKFRDRRRALRRVIKLTIDLVADNESIRTALRYRLSHCLQILSRQSAARGVRWAGA